MPATETTTATVATFGLQPLLIIAGFAGGAVSLIYINKLTVKIAGLAMISGISCASFLTPLIVEYFHLSLNAKYALAFIIGIMGLNLVGGFYKLGELFKKDPLKVLKNK